jgi:subtilisin family serine protease
MSRLSLLAAIGVITLAACTEVPVTPSTPLSSGRRVAAVAGAGATYVIIGRGNTLPGGLDASVASAGGVLTSNMVNIGVAVATSSDPAFAAKAARISGIQDVVPDVVLDFSPPTAAAQEEVALDGSSIDFNAASVGAVETFRAVQWAPDAVHAPEAWDAGFQGAGARVAILDGGIRDTHIDIAPNLDATHSISFVPNAAFNSDSAVGPSNVPPEQRKCGGATDTFWHGTHVAGIVAAPANNVGTVGIAPQATIIGVKVLHCGSGAFSWIINGIYYAATPISEGGGGANIINMSLGALIDGRSPGINSLLIALSRATSYANKRGVTVIAAAGNNAIDIDHTNNLVFVPAQSVGVLAVAATAPSGFYTPSPLEGVDAPASYTNFGQSAISFAAPGCDTKLFASNPGGVCVRPRFPTGAVVQFCWVLDLVMAPCRGSGASISTYCWAAGTSMASPAVAGVAALIVGKYGPIGPAQVEAILRSSADDLGKPGQDDFYGKGRVNAFRAVQ